MPLDWLVATLMKAKLENRLERQLQQLSYTRVLLLDEIGYLSMTREEASLFFRLLNRQLLINPRRISLKEKRLCKLMASVYLAKLVHTRQRHDAPPGFNGLSGINPACSDCANLKNEQLPSR